MGTCLGRWIVQCERQSVAFLMSVYMCAMHPKAILQLRMGQMLNNHVTVS